MVRKLIRNSKEFEIRFDEYGVIDTISCNSKLVVSTNSDAKFFINNQTKIYNGFIPAGCSKGDK